MHIETRPAKDLTASELHALLKLRCEVFILEQACPYADIDGQDLLEDTVHLWAVEDGVVLGCIRVLRAGQKQPAIGRVVTAASARGRGVAAELMQHGIQQCAGSAAIRLDAQAHLEHWYGRFGFIRSGDIYSEDGIPHVPMTRETV